MRQCGMGIGEFLEENTGHHGLPPLWSLLAYVMMYEGTSSVNHFWESYRHAKALAENRDRHYYAAYIPKNTSGIRNLQVPGYEIASHQRFIWQNILKKLPVSECAFAYRKGIGIRECARPHVGRAVLIHMDIKNFFGSIRESTVFRYLLRETGYPKQLVHFISRMCCYAGSLPQGACTSPILSNICFRECDETLQLYCREHGLVYTRYSDDLFFSGDVENAGAHIKKITEILGKHGFKVNREKTKVLRKDAAQRILGMTVNTRLQVSRSYRRALRQELHYLYEFGGDAKGAKAADDWLSYLCCLQGKISYVLSADPENEEFRTHRRVILSMIQEFSG